MRRDSGHTNDPELDRLMRLIPTGDLTRLVRELACQFPDVRRELARRYDDPKADTQLTRFECELSEIEEDHCNRDGSISCSIWMYAFSLTDFLKKSVDKLISAKEFSAAVSLTCSVFDLVAEHLQEDPRGELDEVTDACIDRWHRILRRTSSDLDLKLNLLGWLEKTDRGIHVDEYAAEALEHFLAAEFRERECIQVRMDWLDRDIQEQAPRGDGSSVKDVRLLGWAIQMKLQYMDQLGCPQSDLDALVRNYWNLYDVRMSYVTYLTEKNRLDEAVGVLLESKKLDQENERRLKSETEQLIELYQRLGRNKECKAELLPLMDQEGGPSMKRLKQLKAVCSGKEWETFREDLLRDRRYRELWFPLLEEESLYQRLLSLIVQENSLQKMDAYESRLKPLFPEQVRDFYAAYMKQAAPYTTSRPEYAELVSYLKKIESYPDGKAVVKGITEDWKIRYSRRSAMMNELRKAGY